MSSVLLFLFAEQNQMLYLKLKTSSLTDMIGIFFEHRKHVNKGRVVVKIAGSLLSVFLQVVPSKAGKQQFVSSGGVEVLRDFLVKFSYEDKRWDRLLGRACAVLCKVCPGKSLPVQTELSPVRFELPDVGHGANGQYEGTIVYRSILTR